MIADDLIFETMPDYNILVVEDDDADLVLIKKQITKIWPQGRILAVKSLQEAYGMCKKNNINLVVLDLNLPDSHGPNTVREMRRFNQMTPIIVVTSLGTSLTIEEAKRLGASNGIFKSQVTKPKFFNMLRQSVVR